MTLRRGAGKSLAPKDGVVGQLKGVREWQSVVDRRRQLVEEPPEALEIGGVERRTAQRAELACGELRFAAHGLPSEKGKPQPR